MGNRRDIRVLIAHDHALLRGLTKAILESLEDFDVVGEFSDMGSALSEVRRTLPDVVLLGKTDQGKPGQGVFERFTDRARRVVILSQEEVRLLNHNYIGTEHILLGLIHVGEGVAAKALESLGISLEKVRQQVEEIIGAGQSPPSGHIPFTARAKKVLELSLREAIQLGHNYIGTEHILLGLIRESEGVAAQVLVKLGADLGRVRRLVIELAPAHSTAFESRDWIKATREIGDAFPHVAVAVLFSGSEEEPFDEVFDALDAGAAGCVLMAANTEEWVGKLKAVSSGEHKLDRRQAIEFVRRLREHKARSKGEGEPEP